MSVAALWIIVVILLAMVLGFDDYLKRMQQTLDQIWHTLDQMGQALDKVRDKLEK